MKSQFRMDDSGASEASVALYCPSPAVSTETKLAVIEVRFPYCSCALGLQLVGQVWRCTVQVLLCLQKPS